MAGWLQGLSWELTPDVTTLIPLLVGEASGVFAGFCPSWFTVASPFFHEQGARAGNIKRIRWGEVAATAIVMSTGVALSVRTANAIPLATSAVITGIFIVGYEYQIAHPSTETAEETAPAGTLLSWPTASRPPAQKVA